MDLFAIILKDDVAVDPRKYGPLVAPVLGITVVEAKMAVRRGRGIFLEDVPEEHARRLAETLEADGIGCWCVPASALPPLRQPKRATSVETNEEGVRCALQGRQDPVLLPWDRIGVVSIGLVLVPELQAEIAGVRTKDVAALVRREQEMRDFVRDRLLAVLTRVDLSHQENAPPSAAHHYFFDQLRRKEAMQMKAFADLVSADGTDWWRVALEETTFVDRSDGSTEGPGSAGNFMAVPILYARRADAHADRSRKLLQGGNAEQLSFRTVEDFNRYTRWWTVRERLRAQPEMASLSKVPAPGGNGRAPDGFAPEPVASVELDAPPGLGWKTYALAAGLILMLVVAGGMRFERRGAQCMVCQRLRQDDVLRVWGFPVRESLGEWKETGSKSAYDQIIGRDHPHLYDGFGFEQEALFGFAQRFGRTPGGNASPEESDAIACANGLLVWRATEQATLEEVKAAYPRLYDRVKNIRDPAARQRWVKLAKADPDRQAPGNLLEEISK